MGKQQNTENVINTILHIILIVITVIAKALEIMLVVAAAVSKIFLAVTDDGDLIYNNSGDYKSFRSQSNHSAPLWEYDTNDSANGLNRDNIENYESPEISFLHYEKEDTE